MKRLVVGLLNKDRGIEISLLLQSLLNQTHQDFDIIIIDDNSNDFLYENSTFRSLLKLHENLNHNVTIIKGKRKGPHFSGQLLFENSQNYELIFRLDDDITLEQDCIKKLINCFEDEKVVAVGPTYLLPFKNISEQILDLNKIPNYNELGVVRLINDSEIYVNGALQMNILLNHNGNIETQHLNSGFLYKRLELEKIGGYFLGYSKIGHREESDVSYRLFLNGGKLVICPEAVVFHFHPMFGGIRTDAEGKPNKDELWISDEKLFIERFKNNFPMEDKHNIIPEETPAYIEPEKKSRIIYSKNVIDAELKKQPSIHLVTVTHGNHEKLEKLIESVYQYTTKPYSWIIVNNDPSKESYERLVTLIKKYDKKINISHLQLDKEMSVSEARNIGAKNRPEDSEYICFVDDDALVLGKWSEEDWLTMMYNVLISEKDIGAVSPIYTWFDPLQSYVLSVACLLISVKVWEQVGGFDPVFGNRAKGTWGYEDTDLSYRLQSMGYKIKRIDAENFPFYHEDTTGKKKEDWQEKGLIKAKELLLSKYDTDEIQKFSRVFYPFTKEQMDTIGKKINIGCYYMKLDGFVNIDINPNCNPDILGDIRNLEFHKESVDLILASQVIEHFDLIDDRYLFSRFYEWLKPGGHLVIEVPNVGKILDLVNEKGENIAKYYEYAIYGNQHEIGMKHESQFDEKLLSNMLKEAGFNNIIRNNNTSDDDEITLRYDIRK